MALATDAHLPASQGPMARKMQINRIGLWLFFFSESIIFGLLLSARFFLEGIGREELDQFLGLLITVILLLSSVTAFTAESAMEHGNRRLSSWMLLATILLGVVFTGGVAYEWSIAHFHKDEAFGTLFFTMTGIHALHVISGIVMLLLAWRLVLMGRFGKGDHWGITGTVMYWHFVDVVWVFFYPALYLVS
jgi:cytochrome c oxidase subunit 3